MFTTMNTANIQMAESFETILSIAHLVGAKSVYNLQPLFVCSFKNEVSRQQLFIMWVFCCLYLFL